MSIVLDLNNASGNVLSLGSGSEVTSIVISGGMPTQTDLANLITLNAKVTSITFSGAVTLLAFQYIYLGSILHGSKIQSNINIVDSWNSNWVIVLNNLSPSDTKVVSITITSLLASDVTPSVLALLITHANKLTVQSVTGTITMTPAQSAVLQPKFPGGSIVLTAGSGGSGGSGLYTLSGDSTNGSQPLVTSVSCAVTLANSLDGVTGNKMLVIDFTAASKPNTFTQSNNNTIELDAVIVGLSNVNMVKFISSTNTVQSRAVVAPASTIQSSALSLFPVVWGGTQYNFQPISVFLTALAGSQVTQTAAELADLFKARGAFTVYLQQLNTSVYSEVAADLVLKPTTQNAVATFKATPTQMNSLFTINDSATPKTVTLNSSPTMESVFGQSWLDSFQITYSDLFPSISFPNTGPTDNVITDMQKALFHVVLPTATLLPTNYTSLFADAAALIQAEYNNGMQLRALAANYFTNNAAEFHAAIQEAYTNTTNFTSFQVGDVIQWKVTMHVPLENLGAPPGSSSGTSLSQTFSRVYLFQILVEAANFSAFDVTKYGKLVSEDDTAVGIFNTGNSNSATNKRTYPYQYVNLGNNAYVATGINKNTTKYGATSYQAASGANVIGDAYTNNV